MKKMILHAVSWITLCFFSNTILAQQKLNNYFEIVNQAEKHFSKVGKNSPDYKLYKRWQWYTNTRTALNGDLVNISNYKQQALTQTNWMAPTTIEANTGSWVFLGPNNVTSPEEGIGRVNRIAFHPSNASIIYAATAGGGLWRTTNGGGSWSSLTNGLNMLNTCGIVVDHSNANTLYLLTGDGDGVNGGASAQFGYSRFSTGVLKSTDGGSTWYQTGLQFDETDQVSGYKIIQHPTNENILLVATDLGIYKTTNGGNTWSLVHSSVVYDIEFRPNNPSTIYASGRSYLFRSNNTGTNWSFTRNIPGISNRTSIAICPSNDTRVYILAGPATDTGEYRGFFRFNNTDSSIVNVHSAPNILGRSSTGNDDAHQSGYDLCLAVNPTNSNNVITGGIYAWRTTNGGSSFSFVDDNSSTPASKYHADIHDLVYNPLDNKLYMACDGGMYVSSDNGITFEAINTNLAITQYYKISSSKTNADLILGGAQDNGTNKRTTNSTYSKVLGADGMDCAFGNSSNAIHFASAQDGVIYRSGNSGSSFSQVASPEAVTNALGFGSTYLEGQWCTPIALHPNDDNILFIGYNHLIKATRNTTFGIYTYEDLTGTSSTSAKTFLKTGVSNTNRIYIADNAGYYNNSNSVWNIVRRSDDGGGSWTTIRSQLRSSTAPVTDLAVNPGNSLEVWLTYGGYQNTNKVFYSSDGGANWSNVTGTLPNVPINCVLYGDDATNANDPVYIGTDIGVFYKDNTLADWIPFSNGLPSVEVSDLELNITDNLLRAGTYGRGMWQTTLYSSCVPTINLTTANQNTHLSYYHQASTNITSTAQSWGNSAEVYYKAGTEIELKDGFWASALDTTSVFRAFVGQCGGGVPSVPNSNSQAIRHTGYLAGQMKQANKVGVMKL